ncbi:putative cytochrome P450 [Xylariaceae sp. FL1019]|nr:putative cytochrome P450 [Xylariaceae sp. FL1019]
MLALLCASAVVAYVIWTRAFVRLPIGSNNIIWILLQSHVWKILGKLPVSWTSYPRFSSLRGPDTIRDIVTRHGDFQRPIAELSTFWNFTARVRCISTANWENWPRHREVMATPFNETIMKSVWDVSIRQATAMSHSWASASEDGIPSYQQDTRRLSLDVLAAIGFGKPYDFSGSAEPRIDEVGNYRDSLQTVLDNIILLMLVAFNILRMFPRKWARIGDAGISFKNHIRKGLSKDEIFGNLFIINFAGHDTTDHALAFAMLLMAAHLEEHWLAEGIKLVTGDSPVETRDYKEMFPRTKHCRATIYEVLRLYTPVSALPSIASHHTQTLKVGTHTLAIPEGSNLTSNIIRAMQAADKELIVPNKNIFFPWGEGPQMCPGMKFAEVKAVGVSACCAFTLLSLLRDRQAMCFL